MSNEFKAQFVNEMNRLAGVFSGINNKERIARYFGYIADLDINAVREIVNGFLDNSRQMPLPVDFEKAAKDYKKNYYLKTGKYWQSNSEDNNFSHPEILCQHCFDTGIIKIINIHDEKNKLLIRCNCETGLNNPAVMPHWDYQLKNLYIREALDPKWFNPNLNQDETEEISSTKLMKKVDEWIKQIKTAESYWIGLGYTQNSNLRKV